MPAFFRASLAEFLSTGIEVGLHRLTLGLAASGFDLKPEQHAAWMEEWPRLDAGLRGLTTANPDALKWCLLLEYPIPGREKRVDAVLLSDAGIIVVEFKSGSDATSAARWQAREYCWNLRDFHRESLNVPLAPILCIAELHADHQPTSLFFSDRHQIVLDIQACHPGTLTSALQRAHSHLQSRGPWPFDAERWDNSPFEPTPTVIEFAQRVFSGHDVREIAHAHADNTDVALDCLRAAIEEARRDRKRIICFVTGVPGAGKTLVGLNASYRKETVAAAGGPVCFASGNQPLLDVLKAALVLNRARTARQRREVAHDVTAPVQNVHEFARQTLSGEGEAPPPFHAVVFDEAQRVWNAEKVLEGLNKRKRRGQLSQQQIDRILSHGQSEPELLLSLMERCPEWCVVAALVGGGQEIHDGEAGLAEWGRALANRKVQWTAWVSNEALAGGISNASQRLFVSGQPTGVEVVQRNELHLAVSKRCRRAERYADWVNLVVTGQSEAAAVVAAELAEFPVFLVRDLEKAREVIRSHADAGLRSGLLASSGAARLRAEGIEVSADFRSAISYPDWFLRPTGDIRSSSQLEVAATEFECQGLELDWCCVCWGGDFVMLPGEADWQFRRLRPAAGKAPRWFSEASADVREFVRNKYRVLLTRARLGVVIFVPRGSTLDSTREPEVLDSTARFLVRSGAIPT